MRHPRLVAVAVAVAIAAAAQASSATAGPALEARFDAQIDPAEMGGWMKTIAAEPNHVGSPHNKANADLTLKQFREWGWDAKIENLCAGGVDVCRGSGGGRQGDGALR